MSLHRHGRTFSLGAPVLYACTIVSRYVERRMREKPQPFYRSIRFRTIRFQTLDGEAATTL